MNKIFFSVLGLILVAAAGCRVSTPLQDIRPAVPPLRKADEKMISDRCSAVRKIFEQIKVRGIGLYPRAFDMGYTPEDICKFVSKAGFNRIYFHISSESELDERLMNFIAAAEKADLPVEIVVRQGNFHARPRGNRLIRDVRPAYPEIPEAVTRIIEFNATLAGKTGKLDGVTVMVEPHVFTAKRARLGQIYAWSEKTFGPGMDNDMMMRDTLKMLAKIDTGDMPLTVAVPDFYDDLVSEGKLSCGSINDFISANRKKTQVILVSSANKPSQVLSGTRLEFSSRRKDSAIMLGIELAGHVSATGSKLRRRDWRDFTRILKIVIDNHKKYPEFKGVVITPLAVFEYLMMEQE